MPGCLALIRVRVPDRPGALGLVASRIGALKGDIVGIEVLDRNGGIALDELAVVLPDADLIPAVTREIDEVDGVITESVSIVDALPEPRLDAVRTAIILCRAPSPDALLQSLADEVAQFIRADWSAVLDGTRIVAMTKGTPATDIIDAAAHLEPIGEQRATLAIGREHPLRPGEQLLVESLCELADELWT